MRVSPGDTILYQIIEDGNITLDSYNTYCTGVNLPLHHARVRFTMHRERFLQSRDGKIVAQGEHLSLSKECWNQNSCISENNV
jgi:hypothetical protein